MDNKTKTILLTVVVAVLVIVAVVVGVKSFSKPSTGPSQAVKTQEKAGQAGKVDAGGASSTGPELPPPGK